MQAWLVLLFYLIWVLLGGALLAPGVYALVQIASEHYDWLEELARKPFARYLNRCMMIQAVIGLWPLLRGFRISSWLEIGLCHPRGQGRHWLIAFGLGMFSVALILAGGLLGDAWHLKDPPSIGRIAKHLVQTSITAGLVGTIEELIFRGVLLGVFARSWNWFSAWIFSSVLYAVVHFFTRPVAPTSIHWHSGLTALPGMFMGLTNWHLLLPAMLNLILAGLALGLLVRRAGNLWMAIGLHIGWIFGLKTIGFLWKNTPTANTALWGSKKLLDGWIATVILLSLLALIWRCSDKQLTQTSEHSKPEQV
ncbi:MAG TPA: CPBP family intramembrane metalloprotease [Candidatus Paceibacterota bacterium]|nr:CPBP family intramembrane metalloprotease [Verrucomicrobiota bacterium]HRY48267.1 CPBP family intramembrane metalloprotease [Candidatus Paceibacterota bacterium]HSA00769.1 CPBP family intramembrane metalloprotease [Candidatus Paceibacterota bacterium]